MKLFCLILAVILLEVMTIKSVVPTKAFLKVPQVREALQEVPYALIDCGASQRLEKFGQYIVKRPCPTAFRTKRYSKEVWENFDLSYELQQQQQQPATNDDSELKTSSSKGVWVKRIGTESNEENAWIYDVEHFKLRLHPLEAGQVGVFPEQRTNWKWLRKTIINQDLQYQQEHHGATKEVRPFRILNGFAYTGASTLSCLVHPSVQVTHLDASKTSVQRAKANYNLSEPLLQGSVRWIIDDCMTFIQREIKRKKAAEERYDGLIVDPPAFGRSSDGNIWSLDKDLPTLINLLPKLLSDDPKFVLITCHDRKWSSQRLCETLKQGLSYFGDTGQFEHGELILEPYKIPDFIRGNALPLGSYVRWSRV